MLTCLALAAAALLWPTRWSRVRPAGPTGRRYRPPGPGGRRLPVRALVGGTGICVVAAAFALAGVAGALAAAAMLATAARLAGAGLADRRRHVALVDILAGLRMLGRELQAGAEPATAAANAGSAAKGEGARVLASLAQLARSGDRTGNRTAVVLASDKPADDPATQVQAQLRRGWLLTQRHGLAFTPLIEALAVDVAEQLAADAERSGQVAGPRTSGYVMAVLPLMGLALGIGMGADPVRVLLDSSLGNVLLLVGVLLTCAGLLWSARIVRR